MATPLSFITDQVRQRVRLDGVDLGGDQALARRYVRDEVQRYSERALGGAMPMLGDETVAEHQIIATITGFGVLQPFLDDPEIEEIWINGPDRVFVARSGVAELTDTRVTATEIRDLVERMLQSSGRRVDLSSPFVDASLPDGSRLHCVIPDVTRFWSVNIRKFSRRIKHLEHLVALGTLTRQSARFLRASVLAGQNILVSGSTQSGKTTMLNALLSSAPPGERIVTVEETFELDLSAPDTVAMQCRQPSLEGTGEVTLRRLIKEALRMRPDRLVVGEVREAESLDLLIALNSGLPGMCSIHANSARDALVKLSTLPLLAGRNIDSAFVVPTVASVIDIVVFCELQHDGHRRVTEILATSGSVAGSVVEASTIFAVRNGVIAATGSYPAKTAGYRRRGIDLPSLLSRD
ncbi:CpaF family protein [Marisediminicola senii]|uniref:CpaF family protein n=1 Tax=Marisediminicola senii TaxID=2711233 RepID=UPI0013EC1A42|nr:ATPase, T2SS/T4P/T4SS family [Marisediminicola senii]